MSWGGVISGAERTQFGKRKGAGFTGSADHRQVLTSGIADSEKKSSWVGEIPRLGRRERSWDTKKTLRHIGILERACPPRQDAPIQKGRKDRTNPLSAAANKTAARKDRSGEKKGYDILTKSGLERGRPEKGQLEREGGRHHEDGSVQESQASAK